MTMKKIFTVDGHQVEFKEIRYLYEEEESETMRGFLIHDIDDVNHDGDGVIGNGCTMPETDEEAAAMLKNEYIETYFRIEDGIYYI